MRVRARATNNAQFKGPLINAGARDIYYLPSPRRTSGANLQFKTVLITTIWRPVRKNQRGRTIRREKHRALHSTKCIQAAHAGGVVAEMTSSLIIRRHERPNSAEITGTNTVFKDCRKYI